MKKTVLYSSSLLALTTLLAAGSANAQSMDYGSLQTLFGEPVTTSATGTPQRVSEVPANMTIVTADEIRQSGSRNIPEILSRVPGLNIFQDSLNSYDVGVRGYQQPFQPRLLVLVDGRQVFLDDYSRTLWDNIPVNIDDIRQIEVVKGAASAIFGSNAAGGVINIVTYSPIYDKNNVASVSLGSQNQMIGDGTVTFNGAWGGTKTSAGGLNADAFNTARAQGDVTPDKPFHRYIVNNSIFQLTPTFQLTTEANYSESHALTADPTDFGTIGNQHTTTYSVGTGFNWQSNWGLITNNTYFNHSFVDLFETTSGGNGENGGTPYGLTTDLLVSQLQDQFKVGADHTIRLGTEFRYKAFKNDGVQYLSQTPSVDEIGLAASGTWLWQINNHWSWTNAARVDHTELQETGTLLDQGYNSVADYSHSVNALSANSDFVYKPDDVNSYRFGYGRGVQLPSLMNNSWNIILNYGADGISDFEGNPRLKPTVVQDYSADYDRKIDPINSHLKFSLYYELNQDIAEPFGFLENKTIQGTSYPVYIAQNVGNSSGYGGEIQLKGNSPTGFRWDASYSFARVSDSAGVKCVIISGSCNGVNYEGSSPQHQGRILLGYTTGKWEFDTNTQLMTGTNLQRSLDGGSTQIALSAGGFVSEAARVGYKVNDNLTAALSGTNLTRKTTPESPYPAIEREALLSLTGKF